jgi:hypothetical protein
MVVWEGEKFYVKDALSCFMVSLNSFSL